MPRTTRDANTAVERISKHLPDTVKVEKAKRNWNITVNNYTVTKNRHRALALIVTMLQLDPNFEGIRELVAWNGRIPISGLSGWELHALNTIHYGGD